MMKKKLLVLFLAVTQVLVFLTAGAAEKELKVLAIGNSFTDSLRAYLPQVVNSVSGCKLDIDFAIIGGSDLYFHYDVWMNNRKEITRRPYYGKKALQDFISSKKYDIVTIQQHSSTGVKWKKDNDLGYAGPRMLEIIRKYQPQAKIMIQQTWSYRFDDPNFGKNWNITPKQMYKDLRNAQFGFAAKHGLEVIPTGDAVELARDTQKVKFKPYDIAAVEKLTYPAELPDQTGSMVVGIFWAPDGKGGHKIVKDSHHLNNRGKYLQACVWFGKLFDRPVGDIKFVPAELDADDAAFLRSVAAKVLAEKKTAAVPAEKTAENKKVDKNNASGWLDNFDNLNDARWVKIPSIATIVPYDQLSAANRVARVSPQKGQTYFLSNEKFVRGDLEISFKARPGREGNIFYYIGFHETDPWLKSICWVSIHNSTVTFGVKTPDGKRTSKKIGYVNGEYQTLVIKQSGKYLTVEFDGKKYEFKDQRLLHNEPMPVFVSTNTESSNVPAELHVDYVKVSGGRPQLRMAPHKMSADTAAAAAGYADLTLKNGKETYAFDLNGGLHWKSIRRSNSTMLDEKLFSPVFAVRVGNKMLYSHEMDVTKVEKSADKIVFTVKSPELKITALLSAFIENNTFKMSMSLTNDANDKRRIQAVFPIINNILPDNDFANAAYFFPWRGGVSGTVTADFTTEYGGLGWWQLMFAYNTKTGNGLYFFPEDATGIFKGLRMQKFVGGERPDVKHSEVVIYTEQPQLELVESNTALAMAQYYRGYDLAAGESWSSPAVRFVTYNGAWKEPLRIYSNWMRSRMKPVKVPRWFRDTFTWNNAHTNFFYDTKNNRYMSAKRLVGGEDAQQTAFWDNKPIEYPEEVKAKLPPLGRGQNGQFIPDLKRGGDATFNEEVRSVQAKGTRYTVYIDHRFCWRELDFARKYGKLWATMDANGNYPGYTRSDDQYLMCFYDQDKWVEYMTRACERLIKVNGLDGIYLDELGIAFQCFNPAHDHFKRGEYPIDPQGLNKSITKVRDAMIAANPEAALMTEHASSDYLTQFFDGSWDQTFYMGAFPFTEKYYDQNKICYFRFYYPEFKLAEWGSSKLHPKRCLFNGMGMDMGGFPDTDIQRLYARAMKENGDAFASLEPEPIIPTTVDGLIANRFPAVRKMIYTFFNTSDQELTGSVKEVPVITDLHYVELLRDNPVDMDADGRAKLSVKAKDVALLGCFPRLLAAEWQGRDIVITFPAASGEKVIICEHEDDSHFHAPRGKSTTVTAADGKVVYHYRDRNAKIIIKLLKDDYLVDEVIL